MSALRSYVEVDISEFDDADVLRHADWLIAHQRIPGAGLDTHTEADARLIADLAEAIASGDVEEALRRLADAVRGHRAMIDAIDIGRRRGAR